MDMILGPGFLAGAMVLFAWAYVTFRRPDAARWTTNEFVAQAVTVSIAAFLALGIGFTATAVVFTAGEQFSLAMLAGGLVLLLVGGAACRRAFREVRRLEAEANASDKSIDPARGVGAPANQPGQPRQVA